MFENTVAVSIDATTSDTLQGIIRVEGVLSYADKTLTLEYKTTSVLPPKSSVQMLQLALKDLRGVELKKGIVGSKIVVQVRRMALLEHRPGVERDKLVLKLKRGDRERAAELVSQVRLELSELKLEEL
jgi:hypothetical protein